MRYNDSGPLCRSGRHLRAEVGWKIVNGRRTCAACRRLKDDRRPYLRRRYGIDQAEYEQMMVAQGGLCAICSSPPSRKQGLDIDHDHATGKVRALLCTPCNTDLSGLESPKREVYDAYLASFR